MSTFVYSPGVRIYIDTLKHGILDVSEDITSGSLQLLENAPHSLSFKLANNGRKYDSIFTPNDRIICQLKRLHWLQVFAGYLDDVPLYTVYPGSVPLKATCSLKKLQYTLYDPGSQAFVDLWNANVPQGIPEDMQDDTKFTDLVRLVLVNVAKWCGPSEDRIHIGALPGDWMTKLNGLYRTVSDRITIPGSILGDVATSGGNAYGSGGVGFTPSGGAVGPFPLNSAGALEGWQVAAYAAAAGFTGEALVIMVALAYAESSLRPGIVNSIGATGLWQVLRSAHPNYDPEKLLDPAYNAQAAFEISGGGGNFTPWEAYTPKETYKAFLDDARNDIATMAAKPASELTPQSGAPTYSPSVGNTLSDQGGLVHGDTTTSIGTGPPYPMPDSRPRFEEYSWGGFSNGQIPLSAMTPIDQVNGGRGIHLHPWAAKAYMEMLAAADKDGVKMWCTTAYRDLAEQGGLVGTKGVWSSSNAGAAPVGRSVHGWGFAIDIGPVNAQSWAEDNGASWGWKRTVPNEPWHFEFWPAKFAPDNDISHGRVPAGTGTTGAGGSGSGFDSGLGSLTALYNWQRDADVLSSLLVGPRALLNDHPVMELVTQMFQTSQRSYCSAPNGDILAWFPDYFGAYGMAGRIIVEDIELQPFNIMWSDAALVTHQFVTGSQPGIGYGAASGALALDSMTQMLQSMGIASVEFPELLQTLFNFDPQDPAAAIWSTPEAILKRFGARVNSVNMLNIAGKQQEFWWAVYLFQRNWARQFSTSIPLTFMPEAFPGMILEVPSQGIQMYVEGVTHTWDLRDGGGFTTSCTCTAPATTGQNKFIGLPHAGNSDRSTQLDNVVLAPGAPSAGTQEGD